MRDPDLSGIGGCAWDVLTPTSPTEPDHQAALAAWILNVPGVHPWWQWWMLHVIHLRDIPGVPPANKHYPEAEYEFGILSLNPEFENPPDIEALEAGKSEGLHFLTPPDVCKHFHGITDQDARRLAALAVRVIVQGKFSPDQDYRSHWNHAIDATVEHFRGGKHPSA